MPGLNIRLSLSEILEVWNRPLTDTEIWALLWHGVETLQDLFIQGQAHCICGPTFVINPDTTYLTSEGHVKFRDANQVQQYGNYMAPEMEQEFVATEAAVEQIYVFAFGKSLIYSSEYGLKTDEPVKISKNLENLLRCMTHRNPSCRATLLKVIEACSQQKECLQRTNYAQTVTNLYQTVLGTDGHTGDWVKLYNSTKSQQNISPQELTVDRSRRKQKSSCVRRLKQKSPEHYRSRSHSKSRSRSQSRSNSTQRCQGNGSASPDSKELPMIFPLLSSASHAKSVVEKFGPELSEHLMLETGSTSSRSYQTVSDILSSSLQSGRSLYASSSVGQNSCQSIHNLSSLRVVNNPAFRKYLKLIERQRKLRALRLECMKEDDLSDIVVDHISGTQSSKHHTMHSEGVYHTDIHLTDRSSTTLWMNRDAVNNGTTNSNSTSVGDLESQYLGASVDIIDPYIQQLQQLTEAPLNLISSTLQVPAFTNKTILRNVPPLKQRHREFYGPEFVFRSSKPIKRIPLLLQWESHRNPSHVCRIAIILLSGQKFEALVDPCLTGQQLFEAIVTEIELPEFYYFGLAYMNDSEHLFIALDTKLYKVAPDGWKDSWKREASPITFTVHLRVKFYVDAFSAIKHESTRQLFYLQLRRDLLEDRCLCDENKAIAIAAFALQAEYGDYSMDVMDRNYFIPEHYFSQQIINKLDCDYLKGHVENAHQELCGMSDVEAQIEFIKLVQEHLPEYGIHFHKLLKKKGDVNNVIWIGISMSHLTLAESAGNLRVFSNQYPWCAIQKLSFNKCRFSIQPRPDIVHVKPFKLNFYSNSYKKGQYLLNFCTVQHKFQLKMKTRQATLDGSHDLSHKELTNAEDIIDIDSIQFLRHTEVTNTEDVTDMNSIQFEGLPTPTDDDASVHEWCNEHMPIALSNATDHMSQSYPAAYRNPPQYRSETTMSLIGMPVCACDSNSYMHAPRSASKTNSTSTWNQPLHINIGTTTNDSNQQIKDEKDIPANQLVSSSVAYVIDASIHTEDQTLLPHYGNKTISDNSHQCLTDELLSTESTYKEREVLEICLKKQPKCDIGIIIMGGDRADQQGSGFFVQSVTANGPAFQDGRVQPGDRLIAINDVYLEGFHHSEMLDLIRNSTDMVKLLISQVRPKTVVKVHELKMASDKKLQQTFKTGIAVIENNSEEFSSSEHDGSILHIVINVSNNVHNSVDKIYKMQEKNQQNIKYTEKKTDVKLSIPHIADVDKDQKRYNSTMLDVHSMMQQVDLHGIQTNKLQENAEFPVSKLHADSDLDKSELVKTSSTSSITTTFMHNGTASSDRSSIISSRSRTSFKNQVTVALNQNVICNKCFVTSDNHSMAMEDIYRKFVNDVNTHTVELIKGNNGLGFSTVGEWYGVNAEPEYQIIRIKKVFPIGPAADSHMIHCGDVILAVNNKSVKGLTHIETLQVLRGAGRNVGLVICHPDSQELPPLIGMDSEDLHQMMPPVDSVSIGSESDSCSELDVIPKHEVLITPPIEFVYSSYPEDEYGHILPKVVSPLPLPVNLPSTMLFRPSLSRSDLIAVENTD